MVTKIAVGRGLVALVDDDDADLVSAYRWHVQVDGHAYYAIRREGPSRGPSRIIRMHRVIRPDIARVDHANGNGLDNRRSNLRAATHADNMRNGRKRTQRLGRPSTSLFKGVGWHRPTGRWRARITINRVEHHLGLFASQTEAARAYDHAAREAFGEFARLNFPR